MRLLLLSLLCLGWRAGQAAQTAPPTPAASGTKNVGADRADAPQAPGMTTPTPGALPAPRHAARKANAPGKAAKPPKK
ncbi:hypothetical protein HHL22_15320 [Hymenobacter sp. RP-2-7]|uniref:Uncharacterized protein n=1 Tax=Hymenobacter polaris TaxID=2682546 RepID=A0A7Y0AFT7_9BACT|nr:hypothetical protein [Hymenobacter polaris]NML66578.1 hypothetical protein [Hymenobacter polaris]